MTNPSSSQNERDEQLPLADVLTRYVQESEEGIKRRSEALRAQYERSSPIRWPVTALSILVAGFAVFFAVEIGTAVAGFGGGVLFTLSIGAIALAHTKLRL